MAQGAADGAAQVPGESVKSGGFRRLRGAGERRAVCLEAAELRQLLSCSTHRGCFQQLPASGIIEAGAGQAPPRICAILASVWVSEPCMEPAVRVQPSPRAADAVGSIDAADPVMPAPSCSRAHQGEYSVSSQKSNSVAYEFVVILCRNVVASGCPVK